MRSNVDFTPFYRSSIGFDRIFDLLENTAQPPSAEKWPPYDIAKLGEDSYRIVLAVAGFAENDLSLMHEPNMLVVNGERSNGEEVQYLHHGLALRPFSHRFELADHVSVTGARLENGLLVIDLKKEIPEEMKPRQIPIDAGTGKSRRIEGNTAA